MTYLYDIITPAGRVTVLRVPLRKTLILKLSKNILSASKCSFRYIPVFNIIQLLNYDNWLEWWILAPFKLDWWRHQLLSVDLYMLILISCFYHGLDQNKFFSLHVGTTGHPWKKINTIVIETFFNALEICYLSLWNILCFPLREWSN